MLLYFGNPDRYTTAALPRFFDSSGEMLSGGGVPSVRSDGYGGRPALTSIGGLSYVDIYPQQPAPIHPAFRQFRQGGRFLFEQYPPDPQPILFAKNSLGEMLVCVTLNPDGTLSLYRGTAATHLRTANQVLSLDQFYRIGFKGEADHVAGTAAIQLNRTVIAQYAGDTSGSDLTSWVGSGWGLVEDCALSHYYLGDSYGHQPDLVPDLLVKYSVPESPTELAQWIANTSPYPDAIADSVPDSDSTRLDAFADQDGFLAGLGALDPTEIILAGQYSAMVRNVADYGPAFRHLLSTNGVIREGDVDFPLELEYLVKRHMYYQAAGIGVQGWTYADALATAIGGRMIGS